MGSASTPIAPDLTAVERRTLAVLCDTFLPADDSPWRASEPDRALQTLPALPSVDEVRQRQRILRLMEGPSARMLYRTFHQMGTCHMGADPRTSVVDAGGKCHAVKSLFAADSSLFPIASGVNPMITIAALEYRVVQDRKAAR